MTGFLPTSRWVEAFPIRRRAAFSIFAARRLSDDSPCTVVTVSPGADVEAGRAALAHLHDAHQRIDHPRVARATAFVVDDDQPCVEFDVAAVTDAGELIRIFPTAPKKIPYAAADAFIATLREGLVAGHQHERPDGSGPMVLGRFSAHNVLLDAEGWWSLVGFGHNVACLDEYGVVDGTVTAYHAPEVAAGAKATPSSDYVALIAFMRSVLQFVDIPDMVAGVLRGVLSSTPRELIEHLRWFEQRVMAVFPAERASVQEAVDVSARIRALIGRGLDPAGFAAHAAALMQEGGLPPSPRAHRHAAVVQMAADGSWFVVDGERKRLTGAQRRILEALRLVHIRDPQRALSAWDLFAAGWPGEQASHEASLNRVYVALSRVRDKGLRDVIERYDDGWRFSPAVRIDDDAGPAP